jgi:hypothetical protein
MLTEDEIMRAYGIEEDSTCENLRVCQARVKALETKLRQKQAGAMTESYASVLARANKYERMYEIVLARNEILNRKARESRG